MLVRRGARATVAGPLESPSSVAAGPPRSDMSSTGMTTSISSVLVIPASTMATSRGTPGADQPPRKRATSARGRCVADRPMRWGAWAVTSSRRSSETARWAPRLVAARAWISSMITVSTLASEADAEDVSIR